MVKYKRPQPSLVLDTSCVRGTPQPALRLLVRRGFNVLVSGLAVCELAVYFADGNVAWAGDAERDKIRARMSFLTALLGDPPSFAPTHGALVDKLGGRMGGLPPTPYMVWLEKMRVVWTCLRTNKPYPDDIAAFIKGLAEYVDETGDDFVATSQTMARFGKPTDEERQMASRAWRAVGGLLDHVWIPQPISKEDRFEAWERMHLLQSERAYDRAHGVRRAQRPNDAIDLNMLQHLADGHILLTKDYELIQQVDECGTRQAPWVRTVGEVLSGQFSFGLPFAFNAQLASKKHRARTHVGLKQLDEQQHAAARDLELQHQSNAPEGTLKK